MVNVAVSSKPLEERMSKSPDQAARNNRTNQLNPEHPLYHRARGLEPEAAEIAADAVRQQHAPPSSPPETQPKR